MIPGVPYDAEIEYLESTGTQWIDTGIYGANDISYELQVTCNTQSQQYWIGAWAVNYNNRAFGVGRDGNPNRVYFGFSGGSTVNMAAGYFDNGAVRTITQSGGVLNVDGNTITSRSGTFTTSPYPIYLYAQNRVGSPTIRACIIHYCKFWQGTTLVRDFIPVRVGQTGYMYDRVTRRLFGNKGTGSFVLGPDVAKPVMGLWGMRKFYNARDYIREGLVALFDGIENAGWGVHDGTANKWVDITGNELPLTANQGTLLWHWDSAYNFQHSLIQSENIPRNYSNGYTFELITANGFRNPRLLPTTNIFGIDAWQTNNYYRFTSFGSVSPSLRSSVALSTLDTEKSLSAVMEHTGQGVVYMNTLGRSLPVTNSSTPLSLSGNAQFNIGTRATATFHPPIYAIRLYNRALSPAEIAHNYQIDKARFNLP